MELKEKLDEFLMNDELHTIIINGNWGVGKTYQVDKWKDEFTNSQNEQLHKLSKKEKKYLKQYFFISLSLFGVNDIKELASNAMNEIKRVSNNLIKEIKAADIKASFNICGVSTISFSLSNVVCEIINKIRKDNPNKIFVFVIDDIERKDFKLSIPELFGFVDSLNKSNTKVILIANEEEIGKDSNNQDFLGFKEKVVQREYLIKGADEKAKINILGKQTYELLKDEVSNQDNLRTLRTLSLIESNSDIGGNQLLLKGVLYCLKNIYEGLYTKEDYIQHLFEEKKVFGVHYKSAEDLTDEKIQKEVEDDILRIEDKDNIFFVKNIESKYIFNEIENDYLYDFLDYIFKAIKSGNYGDIRNAPIVLKPAAATIKIGFIEIYNSGNPLIKYYEFLDEIKSYIATDQKMSVTNLLANYFKTKTTFRSYFSEYYSIDTKKEESVEKILFKPLVNESLGKILNDNYNNLRDVFRFEPLGEDVDKYIDNVHDKIIEEYKNMLHNTDTIINYRQLKNVCDIVLRTMGKKNEDFYKMIDIDSLLEKQVLLLNDIFKNEINDDRCFECPRFINQLMDRGNAEIPLTKKAIKKLADGNQINNMRFKMWFGKIIHKK